MGGCVYRGIGVIYLSSNSMVSLTMSMSVLLSESCTLVPYYRMCSFDRRCEGNHLLSLSANDRADANDRVQLGMSAYNCNLLIGWLGLNGRQ